MKSKELIFNFITSIKNNFNNCDMDIYLIKKLYYLINKIYSYFFLQ